MSSLEKKFTNFPEYFFQWPTLYSTLHTGLRSLHVSKQNSEILDQRQEANKESCALSLCCSLLWIFCAHLVPMGIVCFRPKMSSLMSVFLPRLLLAQFVFGNFVREGEQRAAMSLCLLDIFGNFCCERRKIEHFRPQCTGEVQSQTLFFRNPKGMEELVNTQPHQHLTTKLQKKKTNCKIPSAKNKTSLPRWIGTCFSGWFFLFAHFGER